MLYEGTTLREFALKPFNMEVMGYVNFKLPKMWPGN